MFAILTNEERVTLFNTLLQGIKESRRLQHFIESLRISDESNRLWNAVQEMRTEIYDLMDDIQMSFT